MRGALAALLVAGALSGGCGGARDDGPLRIAHSTTRAGAAADPPRPGHRGPWTRWDEARWILRVVEEAGYRVVDETGSALVAEGHDASFYVWTTRLVEPVDALEAGPDPVARVGDVPVYGDEDLWRYWAAQGFVFWLQAGPNASSVLPDAAGLARLVGASRRVRPPPG